MHDDIREIKEEAENIVRTTERLKKTFVKDAELIKKVVKIQEAAKETIKHIKERAEDKPK